MMDVTHILKEQSHAASVLLANIRDVIGDDEEMALTAIEGETNLKEAIDGAVSRILEVEAHGDAIAAQIKALSERKARFEMQAERIKSAIHVALSQVGLRKLELPHATLSIRAVPPKAVISNEAAIPSKFWKPADPTLDRRAVLAALKAGETVPGAQLSNGGETISIHDR